MKSIRASGLKGAKNKLREGEEKQRRRNLLKRIHPKRQLEQDKQLEQNKQVVSNETSGFNGSNKTDTEYDTDTVTVTEYDTDTDIETVIDNVIENVSDNEKREPSTKLKNPSSSSKKKIHKDFEVIDLMCQAISEEDSDFFYSEDLSERFYKVNEERGWLDGSGEPIVDLVKWYKQFYFTELPNGYTPAEVLY